MNDESFFTLAVHAGEDRQRHHGALSVPIYTASVYAFSDAESGAAIHNEFIPGYYYSRLGNPTTDALEQTIAKLEGTFVNAGDAENYRDAIRPNTRLFWIETPSNPLLQITDIRAVAEIAKANGIVTVADNTFATPFNQQPVRLGADIAVHSGTKYLGGHSDLTAGLLVAGSEMVKHIRQKAIKLFGGTISPQVAWLVMRGIKTLGLRMERHNANASAIANMLAAHPKVGKVYYPGLDGHENRTVAQSQMRGFSGIASFDLGSAEAGKAFVNGVQLCTLASSLGGVETLVQHAATMTHATLSPEHRQRAGITDGLIRISVGIEDLDDLKADIDQALSNI